MNAKPSSPAHSRGPWDYHIVILTVTDAEGFSVAEVVEQGPHRVTRANGLLIAAAPDLLRLCQLSLVDTTCECHDGTCYRCQLERAIAKAEGRD